MNVEWFAMDATLFGIGWTLGWLLLWRSGTLPVASSAAAGGRTNVAIVVPARNEAGALPHLLGPLVPQLQPGDELVVVDDHSDDNTAAVARASGADVLTAPDPLPGWLGKPNACWHGAAQTTAPLLLFVDADVRPGPDLIDRICGVIDEHADHIVSVQPWHETERIGEQASVLCNVVALMGSGAFSVIGSHGAPVAYGPVLAVARTAYDRVGGHAADDVHSMHTEDIGLARAIGRAELFTGRPDIRFRMYPEGLRATIRGWTRSIATGARSGSWWAVLATLAWVWSLAGGWLASPWAYPLSALQFWVLGRRAANVHPITALLYPLAVAVFVFIMLRSAVALLFRRDLEWKGRRVPSR